MMSARLKPWRIACRTSRASVGSFWVLRKTPIGSPGMLPTMSLNRLSALSRARSCSGTVSMKLVSAFSRVASRVASSGMILKTTRSRCAGPWCLNTGEAHW
jgi:hypothetical protein